MSLVSKSCRLKQGLLFSFFLNICFLFTFYYVIFYRNCFRPIVSSETIRVKESTEIIGNVDSLMELDFNSLTHLLESSRMIDGRPVRDWVLGILFSKYCVDVVAALDKSIVFHRFESSGKVFYFPVGLENSDFSNVHRFCLSDEFPYSTVGLFRLLSSAKLRGNVNETLLLRFLNSKEFLFFKNLIFFGSKKQIEFGSLGRMIIDGGEELFFSICSHENMKSGVSQDMRRRVLVDYLEKKQKFAVRLLLEDDMAFILNNFSDEMIVKLLKLIDRSDENVAVFTDHILRSSRRDEVKNFIRRMSNRLG